MTTINIDGNTNDTNLVLNSASSSISDSASTTNPQLANKIFRNNTYSFNSIPASISYRFNATGTAYDVYVAVGLTNAASENQVYYPMYVSPTQSNPLKYVGELRNDIHASGIISYQQSGMLFNANYTELNISSNIGGPLLKLSVAGGQGFLPTIPAEDQSWWTECINKGFYAKDPAAYISEVILYLAN